MQLAWLPVRLSISAAEIERALNVATFVQDHDPRAHVEGR